MSVSVVHATNNCNLYLYQLLVLPVLAVSLCLSCPCHRCWYSVFLIVVCVASVGSQCLYLLSVMTVFISVVCVIMLIISIVSVVGAASVGNQYCIRRRCRQCWQSIFVSGFCTTSVGSTVSGLCPDISISDMQA